MELSKIHHIAIIGTDYNKTTDFYINRYKVLIDYKHFIFILIN